MFNLWPPGATQAVRELLTLDGYKKPRPELISTLEEHFPSLERILTERDPKTCLLPDVALRKSILSLAALMAGVLAREEL